MGVLVGGDRSGLPVPDLRGPRPGMGRLKPELTAPSRRRLVHIRAFLRNKRHAGACADGALIIMWLGVPRARAKTLRALGRPNIRASWTLEIA